MTPTVESVLVGEGFLGIPASPLQRAIARAATGESIEGLLQPDELDRYVGTAPQKKPKLNVLICGVRGGKSTLAEAGTIAGVESADLSRLRFWQTARFVIVGPTIDAAAATFDELVGIYQASPVLRGKIVGKPTDGRLRVRRHDGRIVEIAVVPASQGGRTVRNRWLCGFIFEEFAQIGSETEGKSVNGEEMLRAALTRLLPGCSGWIISSPFGPSGELWRLYSRHFGKPGEVVVWHAPTRALNPSFPQSMVDSVRAENPDVAAREYDAQWLDAESTFLPSSLLDPCTRKHPIVRPPVPRTEPQAAMDPGTRGNAWTLTVATGTRTAGDESRVCVNGAWEWIGSTAEPLQPRVVFQRIAEILRPFGIRKVRTDGHGFDGYVGDARDVGLELVLVPFAEREAAYYKTKALAANQALELPPAPAHVRSDLLAVKLRATSSGTKLSLPLTADGRHCDFAPSVTMAVAAAEESARHPSALGDAWFKFVELARSPMPAIDDLWGPSRESEMHMDPNRHVAEQDARGANERGRVWWNY